VSRPRSAPIRVARYARDALEQAVCGSKPNRVAQSMCMRSLPGTMNVARLDPRPKLWRAQLASYRRLQERASKLPSQWLPPRAPAPFPVSASHVYVARQHTGAEEAKAAGIKALLQSAEQAPDVPPRILSPRWPSMVSRIRSGVGSCISFRILCHSEKLAAKAPRGSSSRRTSAGRFPHSRKLSS